jgi:hypothetical protein
MSEVLKQPGLKARIETLLTIHLEQAVASGTAAPGLTIGQISMALGLSKIDHPDISSVLVKLRNAGRLKSAMGPASSTRGKRFVKRHSLLPPKTEKVLIVKEDDLRRQLAFTR